MTPQEKINFKLLAGPLAGVICIALLLATIVSMERDENEQADLYTRAVSVMHMAGEVGKDLSDLQTGQRGYDLTKQAEELQPFEQARQNLPLHLEALHRLLRGDHAQEERLTLMREEVEGWLQIVSTPRPAPVISDQEALRDRQRRIDAAKTQVQEIIKEEENILDQRIATRRYAAKVIEILARTPELERVIIDMEVSVRGYLLTGDRESLEMYQRVRGEYPLVMGHMMKMLAHDPARLESLTKVRELVLEWQQTVAEPQIEAKRAGKVTPATALFGQGRVLMNEIRQRLREFKETTWRHYQESHQTDRDERRWGVMIMAIASVSALLLLTGATMYSLVSVRLYLKRAREAEARFHNFINHSPAVAFMKDADFRYVYINETFERLFAVTLEELRGKTDFDFFPEKISQEIRRHDEEVLRTQRPGEVLETVPTPDGEAREWLVAKFPFQDDAGKKYVGGVAIEITQQRKTQQELAAERERLSVTLRSIGDGVITTDVQGRVLLINKVAESLTGWTQREAVGKLLTEVFRIVKEPSREPCPSPVQRVLEGGQIVELEDHTILLARDGTDRPIADSAAPIFDKDSQIVGVVLVFRDVTEEQHRDEERRKAERLEAIGLLAGGIAHDFNNILTAIVGNIALARLSVTEGDQAWERLQNAEKASYRARDLSQQLLTFAKGGMPVKKTASVAVLVRETAEFFLRGSQVKAEIAIPEDLWPVNIDAVQIGQVIENIVVNAEQAMPHGGMIQIRCENVRGPDLKEPAGQVATRYVKISIEDHGEGIPKEHLQKIFDPYFTTKPKGSGLGLATAYSIIKKHGGVLAVESEAGQGTIFSILLPASKPHQVVVTKPTQPLPSRGHGRILFMDDEPMIRELMPPMLAPFGYEVESVADGHAALEAYQQAQREGRPFAVVILDLTIPGGMGGQELMKQLREIDPKIKGIVSSGYASDPVMAHYADHGFNGVVHKPYEISELQRVVHQVVFSSST